MPSRPSFPNSIWERPLFLAKLHFAPICAATGGAQLLAPVDYPEKSKARLGPVVLPPALLPPAPKAPPDSTSPNGNDNQAGNGPGLNFFHTFWKADANLQQPVLFGAER